MGCSLSAEAPDRRPEQEEEEDALPVSLSAESREAIRSSWREIQEDISRVGVIMFVRLFETHPECKDAFFTFRDLNDVNTLRASKELKAHGLRIMYIIEKTVARIDQDDRLDQLILDLGRKHYQYKALPKYYDLMGEEFIHAIHPVLQERWTSDLEEAWKVNRDSVPVHHSHHEERLPAGPEEPQQQLRAARPITWLQQLRTESLNDKMCSENVVFSSHV
ncbi:neuroglobin-like isoform X1 [Maylandia zebra]|uniref:Neuroglobin-like isoform X1 n=1 Tax=Pundamilia nyererei TaxID=303518 RepID=A0A9Y3SAJ8_9CICH|nr:PREDICTED: neuroglobin-like isoform X1 [Pundamilia nyererei]XP_026050419.1 neuroglobin-like isoform X1 [Astatotilapia calliptera]